jgi:hypothetical protein
VAANIQYIFGLFTRAQSPFNLSMTLDSFRQWLRTMWVGNPDL